MNKIFLNQGYVKKKNFLNNQEKKDILDVIYETFSKEIKISNKKKFSIEYKEFHEKLIELRKKNPKKFGDIYDRLNLNAKLRSLFYSKKFLKIFAKILNIKTENIFLNGFMLRLDVPNDRRNTLDWHQDSSYYLQTYPKMNAGVCWVSLTKNTKKNGALIFLPKSNTNFIKNIKRKWESKSSSENLIIKISSKELKSKKYLNQIFGDVIFLHMNVKHRSGVNKSNKIRITFGCRFHEINDKFNTGKEIYKFNQKVNFI